MTDAEYDTFINEHFSFKWVIKEDLYLNLRLVNHKEHCDTYFLFPLFNMNIKKYIKETDSFPDISENMVAIITFYDRNFYNLTTASFFKEEINRQLTNKNFELLIKFTKMVVVKTLEEAAKKMMNLDEEFIYNYIDYAKFIKRYDVLKEKCYLILEDLENEQLVLEDGIEFQQLITQSIKASISICHSINLENYEKILKSKIDKNIAIEGLLFINNLLNDIGLNNNKFSKVKSYKHAFDFVSNDETCLSSNINEYVFQSFTEGLVNGYMSLAVLNCISNNDIKRINQYKSVLSEFESNNKDILISIEKLIKLYSSKTHKQYLPILSISNSFSGLSEPKIIALANYILPSVNKKTIKTKFEYLNYIDFEVSIYHLF